MKLLENVKKELQPDIVSYNSIISTCGVSEWSYGVQLLEDIQAWTVSDGVQLSLEVVPLFPSLTYHFYRLKVK